MSKYSRLAGLITGLVVFLIVEFVNLPGDISTQGQTCLALTLMVVIWWAFQIAQGGFTSAIFLALLVVLRVADPTVIFSAWTGPLIYLVIGAFLIADAVKSSGLGERIAYNILIRFVTNFKSIIFCIFLITFILSLIIPHPWPRAFLIMAIMKVLIDSAKIPKGDAKIIGLSVFASSAPISLIFLTGDSGINPLALATAGVTLNWLGWFKIMGPPAIVCSILTMLLILLLFKPSQEITMDKEVIREKLKAMGKMTNLEIRMTIWLAIAIALWVTDSIHGINIGWVTLLVTMCMSLPLPAIGNVLTPKSWEAVPIHVLIFLTAAIAIGRAAGTSGMSNWIATVLMPSNMPVNLFVLAAIVTLISMTIHMLLGSVIAVMAVVIPGVLAVTTGTGLTPLATTMLIFLSLAAHYILPFQNVSLLVGCGDENGMYGQKETVRLGVPLIAVIFFVNICVMIPWFKLIGVL